MDQVLEFRDVDGKTVRVSMRAVAASMKDAGFCNVTYRNSDGSLDTLSFAHTEPAPSNIGSYGQDD